MPATYKATAYFSSGPHRFRIGNTGRVLFPPFSPNNGGDVSVDVATRELRIFQTGRLTAATEAALWTLWTTLRAVAEATSAGTLVLHSGKSFTDMHMVRFESMGPIDRGRLFSMPYEIEYLQVR